MVEKEPLFVGIRPAETQVVLDRIRVEKMLRCLHQAHSWVVEKRK